jgi:hypothetical protein
MSSTSKSTSTQDADTHERRIRGQDAEAAEAVMLYGWIRAIQLVSASVGEVLTSF